MNKIIAAALLASATLAHADTSPAKKELVAKVLQLQRPQVEAQARAVAERPAAMLMQSAGAVIQQRVPLEKREPLFKEIQVDVRKFIEEASPMVAKHAVRLMPQTTGAVLESKFSEAELKQLVASLEAPAFRKYQQSNEEMFRPLAEKLAQEARGDVEPLMRTLDQTVRKKLEAAVGSPAGAPPAATKP